MASSLPPPTTSLHRQPLPTSPTPSHSTISLPRFFTCNSSTPTKILSSTSTLFHRSTSYPFFPSISISISNSNSNSISGCRSRCLATSPRPPSPPQSEPPSGKDPFSSSGLPDKFSRFQEVVQIFLAVLFWMSLFFWSSIWDGKNNGRSDKGSRRR